MELEARRTRDQPTLFSSSFIMKRTRDRVGPHYGCAHTKTPIEGDTGLLQVYKTRLNFLEKIESWTGVPQNENLIVSP